jgi:phosphoribosylglycinamide formyltransferase-1
VNIVVLISGRGSNLQALLDAQQAGELGAAQVVLVLADRADAYGLQRALRHKVAAAYVPLKRPRDGDARAAWERRLGDVAAAFAPDLLVLAGFMRVLSAPFLERFSGRVINQHPALLPDGGGASFVASGGASLPALRGAHVVADALRLGLPVSGCTIHYATSAVDDGPVLARAEVPLLPGDDEQSLHERIKAQERRLVVEVVRDLSLRGA